MASVEYDGRAATRTGLTDAISVLLAGCQRRATDATLTTFSHTSTAELARDIAASEE